MKRKVIYAVDFDGTLCKSIYPGIGEQITIFDVLGD